MIGGVGVNLLESYGVRDLSGNLPFVASDVVPANYTDITSIDSWDKHGFHTGKDYKFIRKEIAIIAATTGWTNLTLAEKTTVVDWFAIGKTERDEIYTTAQQITLAGDFHKQSTQSRKSRSETVMLIIYNYFAWSEVESIVNVIELDNLLDKYVNYGVEGTTEGDGEGLFDYFEATAGTSFSSSGLAATSYVPVTGTLAELITTVMSILRGGEY